MIFRKQAPGIARDISNKKTSGRRRPPVSKPVPVSRVISASAGRGASGPGSASSWAVTPASAPTSASDASASAPAQTSASGHFLHYQIPPTKKNLMRKMKDWLPPLLTFLSIEIGQGGRGGR
eukprot:Gb_28093 [translate_table: standard]